MSYVLRFDEVAIEYLEKLPKVVTKRIFAKLEQAKENPNRYFIRLTNMKEYKLRVGDYRVIADIDDGAITIFVLHVDHRKRVHKRFS